MGYLSPLRPGPTSETFRGHRPLTIKDRTRTQTPSGNAGRHSFRLELSKMKKIYKKSWKFFRDYANLKLTGFLRKNRAIC